MAEKDTKNSYAKVIDFPKEVKVYGDFSRVYIKGKDKSSTLILDQGNASPSSEKKSSKEPVLIIPIQQNEGEVEFVKVPLHKLPKQPPAEATGHVLCSKVNLNGCEPTTENIPKFTTEKRNFPNADDVVRTNRYSTCFVFQQGDLLPKDLFKRTDIPEVDLFQFQKLARQSIMDSSERAEKMEERKQGNPVTKDKEVQVSTTEGEVQVHGQRESSKDLPKREESSRSFIKYLVTPRRTN